MNRKSNQLIRLATSLQVILLGFLLWPGMAPAQLNRGGVPSSSLFPDVQQIIPVRTLPPPDMAKVAAEDAANPVPYRFAIHIPLALDFCAEGKWQLLPDGSEVCLLALEAPGAKALSVLFDRFRLPQGGRLFIRSADTRQVLGAFTSENNTPSGKFATQLIHGDKLILEYDQAPEVSGSADLLVGSVAYAYRGVPEPGQTDGFGGAGPCEVNVNCVEGQNYQQEKKGVVRIQAVKGGSSFWCSGSLLNNTRMDGTPYLLTADHCYNGGAYGDLLQWVFYFGYDGPGCENPETPPLERALTGATLKARAGAVADGGSDFLLLLLNDAIPDTFDVFLNGWDRSNTPAMQGVGIHHPQGDIKKISTFTQKTTSVSWIGGFIYTHWLVKWAETVNGHGVTEGGSSGSALFDSSGLVIGQLTGGGSSCDSANLEEPDYYGKFSYSWISNGPDSASQLKPWLDPDNTGLEKLSGKPLAVHNMTYSESCAVFPNPTGGLFSVELSVGIPDGQYQIAIFDIRGLEVYSALQQFTVRSCNVDIHSLPPGIYLLTVTGNPGRYVQKIVKY